jgi:heterodisulfide reductase subunit A2
MAKVNITVDGKAVQVEEGTFVLEACREQGIDIPAPCRYPYLEPRAACRLCAVEVKDGDGPFKIEMSCTTKVKPGMTVQATSPAAVEARRKNLANLMKRCAPSTMLENLKQQMGATEAVFGDDSITCFRCMLCIRVCDEIVGVKALSLKKVKEGDTTPIAIDQEKCILCGACATVCPVEHLKLEDADNRPLVHQDMRLGPNNAITLTFRQAVPNVPRIHTEDCIHFTTGGCEICAKACDKDAINYNDADVIEEIDFGTVIMATGFQDFDPTPMKQFGYGRYPNVVTAIEFEKMNNAAGPTGGKILMENGQEPRSIVLLHCIGSRDDNYHKYCSRVCCMYALKFAHLAKEKTSAEVYQLYIDIRAFGKGYEEFYHRLLEEGVNVVRGKAAEVVPARADRRKEGGLMVRCEDTLIGKFREIPADMVVLCTALEANHDASAVGRKFNISTGADGWYIESHPKLGPVSTTTDGVFLAGVCQGAKDIPDTVAQGGAAAAQAMKLMINGEVMLDAAYAEIMEQFCSGCRICNGLCPYSAISFKEEEKVSYVNAAMCKACGTCVAACPTGAIKGRHFTDEQIYAQIEGILSI